jgi:hypothetical protein
MFKVASTKSKQLKELEVGQYFGETGFSKVFRVLSINKFMGNVSADIQIVGGIDDDIKIQDGRREHWNEGSHDVKPFNLYDVVWVEPHTFVGLLTEDSMICSDFRINKQVLNLELEKYVGKNVRLTIEVLEN